MTVREDNAGYLRRRYSARIDRGECARCGGKPEKGKKHCTDCLTRQGAYLKARREARIAGGSCGACGSPGLRANFSTCPSCLARQRIHSSTYRDRLFAKGLCQRCRKPKDKARMRMVRCQACARIHWSEVLKRMGR